MIDYSFKLNGIQDEKYQPKEFESLEIQADFDNNSVQPNLTATELTLINEGATAVNNYIDGGLNGTTRGIFEGIPYEILLLSENAPYNAFKGYLDLLTIKRKCDEVKIKLVTEEGLANFSERCQALTFGYLYSLGAGYFPQSRFVSVPYVINYIPDGVQILMVGISLYLIGKEIYETVPKIPQYITDLILAMIPNIGIPPSISIGNIIICVIKLALLIVYLVLMIKAIISLIDTLFSQIYSVKRYHKACKIKDLLEQACIYLGFTFQSSLFATGEPFENLVLLPYKTEKGKLGANDTDNGLSSSNAFGYTVYEIFQLCMNIFNAKILIKNGVVYLESLSNKTFWEKQSTYTLPDIEVLEYQYNSDELNPNYVIKFAYDISDMNTIDNFIGTNYERITNPLGVNNKKHLNFGGLKEVSLNVCRATRKDVDTDVEKVLAKLAALADKLIVFFGGSSKFLQGFQNRIGAMQVSQHFGWNPKVLILKDNKIISNNSTIVEAKYLYQNYHAINSFVENNFGGQYQIYKDITIPFCFHDFLQTIENSYFTDANGNKGKFDKITWNFTQMYAKVDYRLQIPYTKNLTEVFIEPE